MANEDYLFFFERQKKQSTKSYFELLGMVDTDNLETIKEIKSISEQLYEAGSMSNPPEGTKEELEKKAKENLEKAKKPTVRFDPLHSLFDKMKLFEGEYELVDNMGRKVELPPVFKDGERLPEGYKPDERKAFLENMKKGDYFFKNVNSPERHAINLSENGINIERKSAIPERVVKPGLWSRFKSIFVKVPEVEKYKADMEYVRQVYKDETITESFDRVRYEESKKAKAQENTNNIIEAPANESVKIPQKEEAPESRPEKETLGAEEDFLESLPKEEEPQAVDDFLSEDIQIIAGGELLDDEDAELFSEYVDLLGGLDDKKELSDEEAERQIAEFEAELNREMGIDEEPAEFDADIEEEAQKMAQELEQAQKEAPANEALNEAFVEEESRIEEPAAKEQIKEEPDKDTVMEQLANRSMELGRETGRTDLSEEERMNMTAEQALDSYFIQKLRNDEISTAEAMKALEPEAKKALISEVREDACFKQAVLQGEDANISDRYRSNTISMAYRAYKEMQEKDISALVEQSKSLSGQGGKLSVFYDKVQEGIEITKKAAAGELDMSDENVRKTVQEGSAAMILYVMSKGSPSPKLQENLARNPEKCIMDLAASRQMEHLIGKECEKVGNIVNVNAFKLKVDYSKSAKAVNEMTSVKAANLQNVVSNGPEKAETVKQSKKNMTI